MATLKWQQRFDAVKKEIQDADFSDKDIKFELTRRVLLDDFDSALIILPKALETGSIERECIMEWPVFQEFCKDERVISIINPKPKNLQNKRLKKVR